jgi:hypothetical protein
MRGPGTIATTMDQHRTRAEVFEAAAALGRALSNSDARAGWEPLRDILLAGLESGGLRPGQDPEALRRAAGELAAIALASRHHSQRT